jgi:hypothetical protein
MAAMAADMQQMIRTEDAAEVRRGSDELLL